VISKTPTHNHPHSHGEIARWGLGFLLVTCPLAGPCAQAIVLDPVIAQIEPLLQSKSPALRGEAALALASTRQSRYYAPILQLASDPKPAARHRALLALGYLQQPGTDAPLHQTLTDAPRDSLDRSVSTMALGLLPEEPRIPAIDEFFVRVHSSSRKRIQNEFTSMLLGLLHGQHPAYRSSLESILEDASYRDRPILVLVLQNLAKMPRGVDTSVLFELLRSPNPALAETSLRALMRPGVKLSAAQRKVITGLARGSKVPTSVRSAALRLLTRLRRPAALDLADSFLRGKKPALAAAAVHTILKLGGGSLREALEHQIINTGDANLQLAMLEAKTPPHGNKFIEACLAMASDTSAGTAHRVHTTLICAGAGRKAIQPILTDLFLTADDPTMLNKLAYALRQLDIDIRKKVYPTKTLKDTARLADRLHALLAAGHKQTTSLLTEVLAAKATPDDLRAEVVRAYRLNQLPNVDRKSLDLAPPGVRALLQLHAP